MEILKKNNENKFDIMNEVRESVRLRKSEVEIIIDSQKVILPEIIKEEINEESSSPFKKKPKKKIIESLNIEMQNEDDFQMTRSRTLTETGKIKVKNKRKIDRSKTFFDEYGQSKNNEKMLDSKRKANNNINFLETHQISPNSQLKSLKNSHAKFIEEDSIEINLNDSSHEKSIKKYKTLKGTKPRIKSILSKKKSHSSIEERNEYSNDIFNEKRNKENESYQIDNSEEEFLNNASGSHHKQKKILWGENNENKIMQNDKKFYISDIIENNEDKIIKDNFFIQNHYKKKTQSTKEYINAKSYLIIINF